GLHDLELDAVTDGCLLRVERGGACDRLVCARAAEEDVVRRPRDLRARGPRREPLVTLREAARVRVRVRDVAERAERGVLVADLRVGEIARRVGVLVDTLDLRSLGVRLGDE